MVLQSKSAKVLSFYSEVCGLVRDRKVQFSKLRGFLGGVVSNYRVTYFSYDLGSRQLVYLLNSALFSFIWGLVYGTIKLCQKLVSFSDRLALYFYGCWDFFCCVGRLKGLVWFDGERQNAAVKRKMAENTKC